MAGGGGGGGTYHGAGGGAGGYLEGPITIPAVPTSYTVTIGGGGRGGLAVMMALPEAIQL